MAEIEVVALDGSKKGKIEIKDEIFNIEPNEYLISEVIRQILANKRVGTASTKHRGEVKGGGAKPWRQKGTGRARAGSIRSPLWVGGGRAHGPKPRDYSYYLPKKQRRLALLSALSKKFRENNLIVVEKLSLEQPKTKTFDAFIQTVCPGTDATVFMRKDEENYANAKLSARNLPYVKFLALDSINVYDIMVNEKLILTKACVEKIQEVYS